MRWGVGGFFDNAAQHGEPIGSGPLFDEAMEKFRQRQHRCSRVGRWRKAPARWKRNDGTFIDPEYYIVDWGQDG